MNLEEIKDKVEKETGGINLCQQISVVDMETWRQALTTNYLLMEILEAIKKKK